MAKKFLSVGAEVLITGRNEKRLRKVQADLDNQKLHVLQWDVSDVDIMGAKFVEAVKILDGCDYVVNNAAFVSPHKITNQENYNKMMDTNMRSVYFMCKNAVDYFLHNNGDKGGKILNISSLSAQESSIDPYFISKTGVDAITRGFAKEYAANNIIVNAIAPGYVASSINYIDINQNAYNKYAANHRIITPEEIAELATFLLSDAANGIVGQIVVCDGGALL